MPAGGKEGANGYHEGLSPRAVQTVLSTDQSRGPYTNLLRREFGARITRDEGVTVIHFPVGGTYRREYYPNPVFAATTTPQSEIAASADTNITIHETPDASGKKVMTLSNPAAGRVDLSGAHVTVDVSSGAPQLVLGTGLGEIVFAAGNRDMRKVVNITDRGR